MNRFILFIFLLSACDSPRNHRIQAPAGLQKAQEEMSLAKFDLRLQPNWVEGPYGTVQQNSKLVIYVYNSKKELTDLPSNSQFVFFATMPSMGHPLDQPGEFTKIAKGVYLNSTIRFNMSGDWQMEVGIEDGLNGLIEQVVWIEFF